MLSFLRIVEQTYMKKDGQVKTVIRVSFPIFNVRLKTGEKIYKDAFNIEEPLDLKTHVFYLPEGEIKTGEELTLLYTPLKKWKRDLKKSFSAAKVEFADEKALLEKYDSLWRIKNAETEALTDGLTFTRYEIETKEKKPVIVSVLESDHKNTTLYVGTPADGYEGKKVRATIPDMITAAENNGQEVFAAVNADFFDIFGDFHPSGLCVKNGRVIANENSPRPFIGIKKDGGAVLTDLEESPGIVKDLRQAAAGLQMIVKDGVLYDWAPLEPFSYTCHPRTAAGITRDGRILLVEADGRIPAHSNGASLVDLGLFMIRLGADRALNLDGGGSSAVYTKGKNGFDLRTVPADLFRPNDKLIRKDFNAILLVKRK